MIRWPWVGRGRLEDAQATIQRLEEQNAKLVDSVIRLKRFEYGLGELPRQPRPPLQPMPETLREWIDGWQNPGIRHRLKHDANHRHIQGESWEKIEQGMREEAEPKEVFHDDAPAVSE